MLLVFVFFKICFYIFYFFTLTLRVQWLIECSTGGGWCFGCGEWWERGGTSPRRSSGRHQIIGSARRWSHLALSTHRCFWESTCWWKAEHAASFELERRSLEKWFDPVRRLQSSVGWNGWNGRGLGSETVVCRRLSWGDRD